MVLTSQPLLGMFCIPLPGSGQVASSKNEGQQLPKRKKRGGKEQFIIKLLWRRHFYSEPKLKLESDVLHSYAARMLNTFINDRNSQAVWLFNELKF